MKASTCDRKFDRSKSIARHLDLSHAHGPGRKAERLRRRAAQPEVSPDVAEEAMRDLAAYRKTGQATDWTEAKRKLGL